MGNGPEITRTGPGDDGVVDLPRGASVGRYVILDLVGEGGMGVVYAAYDPELDRKLALKLMRASGGGRAARRKTRLIREAQAMARLNHRNVITVHDVGSIDDQVFVAMEFIEGGSVGEWIKQPRPWQEVVDIFVEAGRGLAAAHEAGLVHRDFKPDNVMLAEGGRVVVTDFGLARAADSGGSHDADPSDTAAGKLSTTVTAAGAIMGTPAYMAPEQHDARRVDARSDQFAFAVALYECLYGERPFPGEDVASLAYNVTSGNVRPAPTRSTVPAWVRQVLLRALSVDPANRYPTMEALLRELAVDHTIRPRWGGVLVGVGAAAAIGVGAGFLLDRGETPCTGAAARIEAVLGRPALVRAKVGFTGTELAYANEQWPAIEAALKRYGETWEGAYVRVCEATRIHGEQSQLLLDVRMACLTHRLDDAAALVALLGQGDPVAVEHGLDAAQLLPSPIACEDTGTAGGGGAPMPDPEVAAQVEALRPQLARVAALERTGVFTVGLEAARALVLEANEIEYPPVQAEAYLRLASLQRTAARWDVAERNYKEALTRALRGRADDVAAEAAVALVGVVSREPARATEAESWAGVADALLERTESEPDVRAELLTRRAQLLEATGRLQEARPPWSEAILLLSGAYGEDDVRVADASAGLGKLQFRLGEPAAARPLLERALELTEYNVGMDHPKTADLMHTLGEVELALGADASAREHLRSALAVREGHGDTRGAIETMRVLARAHGMTGDHEEAWDLLDAATKLAEDPELSAELQADLARTALARGDWALALNKARRARAQLEGLPDAPVPAIAAVDTMIARALLQLHRFEDARVRARRAITALEGDPDRIESIGEPLAVLGEAWLAEDAPDKAIGPLERALPLLEAEQRSGSAEAKFALARALVASGGSTSRAHALAEAARTAAGPDTDLSSAIEAWLETQ